MKFFGIEICCPACKHPLVETANGFLCNICDCIYLNADGIPHFLNQQFESEEMQYKKHSNKRNCKKSQLNFYIRSYPAKILKSFGFGENSLGIDLGCGSGKGENFEHVYNDVTQKIIAVDVAQGALKKFKNNYPDTPCILSDACRLPFSNEVFDFITASGLVHHFIGQKKFLSDLFNDCYRVIKKEGIFIFNDPNLFYPASILMHAPNRFLQFIKPGARGRVPYERPIYFHEVVRVLEKAGFASINFSASTFAHQYMPKWLIDKIIEKESYLAKLPIIKYFGAWITVYARKN